MLDLPPALTFVVAALGGYLFGSIPFGLVITRAAGLGDIRNIGSGNIGATNVLRTGRKDLALATLLLDAGKAGIAAAIMNLLFGFHPGLIAGAAAFVGHCYPVWLRFKGGKGVATFVGLLFGIMWQVGIAFGVCWLSIAVAFRYSSLAALVTAALLPLFTFWLIGDLFAVTVIAALSCLLFYRHRGNIRKLMAGTEDKIGQKKKDA
jgi:glycerol-3-phosphate acyltransferase PlsY